MKTKKMKVPEYKMYKYKMMIIRNGKSYLISYKDIVCMRIFGDCIEIVVNSAKHNYYVTGTLNYFEKQLPKAFFRCHRSALVNISYIETFDEKNMATSVQIILPLSHTRYEQLLQVLLEKDRLKVPNCNHCEKCTSIANCTEISMFVRKME